MFIFSFSFPTTGLPMKTTSKLCGCDTFDYLASSGRKKTANSDDTAKWDLIRRIASPPYHCSPVREREREHASPRCHCFPERKVLPNTAERYHLCNQLPSDIMHCRELHRQEKRFVTRCCETVPASVFDSFATTVACRTLHRNQCSVIKYTLLIATYTYFQSYI